MEESVLFPFEKIRVKPRTVLIETVLSGDPLITYSNDQTLPYWVPKCVLNLNGVHSLVVNGQL